MKETSKNSLCCIAGRVYDGDQTILRDEWKKELKMTEDTVKFQDF